MAKKKTAEFAENLTFDITTTKGTSVFLDVAGQNWEIKLSQNKCEIWIQRDTSETPLAHSQRFVGRCAADDLVSLATKVTTFIDKEVEELEIKSVECDTNRELCDYLTSQIERKGFEITNKSSTAFVGSYTIEGMSGVKYRMKATYKDSIVQLHRIEDDQECLRVIGTFELSNPTVEKAICDVLVRYDKEQ
jgi:hypothetical protein